MRILAWGLDLGEHPYEKRPKSIRSRGERECLSQGRAGYKWCIGNMTQRQSRLTQAFETIMNMRPVSITLIR